MNKPFFIFLFLFFFVISSAVKQSCAQTNLIYNGDFELYDTCPVSISTPGDPQIETCLGWKSPTYATSDYYNTCATSIVSVPTNTIGYQSPHSGNAYCGLFYGFTAPPNSSYGHWFEYVQGNLTTPLKVGYEYEFSCRIVLSDVLFEYALSKFGAAFTTTAISRTDGKTFIGITPQVMNPINNFIIDTLNWVEIKGKFYAQGNEQYVTIGFFSDTANLDTLNAYNSLIDPTNNGNYYYIDACILTETGNLYGVPNIFTPNNDGQNDMFSIQDLKGEDQVLIFNRWGIKVYELSKTNQVWDGRTTSGTECVEGVYYFVVNNKNEKFSTIKKGFIQLVR